MAEPKASATQERVCKLYGLKHNGTYTHAAAVLEAAGLPKSGCPDGHDWRSVKKLTDDELKNLLGPASDPGEVEVKQYRRRTWGDEIREAKARRRRNEELKAKGYRWVKRDLDDGAFGLGDCGYEWVLVGPDEWVLVGPDGKEVE
ncbi:MAG: hypothetical protein GX202_09680 [Firmicutes bacterium]|nr:hypothetical protein [Bacillota bacterium]